MQTYGILAHPVSHSLSPTLHNAGFEALEHKGKYVKFDIQPNQLANFIQRVRQEKISGLSVSLPHKQKIIQHLDFITPEAEEIKAVNTVYWEQDKLCGTNTDCHGAIRALEEVVKLKDKKAVVFGTGGAAHAIVYGLIQKGVKVTILGRTLQKSQALACPFQSQYGLITSHSVEPYDIVINTTPIGMHPRTEASILTASQLHPNQIVYDIVYNPLKTKLILEAEKAGCTTVTGEKMFLYQGIKQFEIWTGQKAPVETMYAALMKKLKAKG